MYFFLLVVGSIVSVAGLGALVYGALNIDFGFGHTLLVVGTSAFGSGAIVTALALAMRALDRLGDLLAARPAEPRETAPAETALPGPPEERRPVDLDATRRADLDTARRERPRFGAPDTPAAGTDLLADTDMPPLPSTPRWVKPRAPEDAPLRPSSLEGFGTSPTLPRIQRAKEDAKAEAALAPGQASQPTQPAHAPSSPRPTGAPSERPEARAAAGRQGVSILKSGVVDGMAYTLYSDGSIEAELPQGTMRFNSIEELRQHLEGED